MTIPSKEELVEEANREVTEFEAKRVTVLYGDYGKRKTTTACSMVNERGLLLSSDDSWKVLLNERHKDIYSKIKVFNFGGLSQLEYINFTGYDTIIWDTVSQSVDNFLDLLYDKGKWSTKSGQTFREHIMPKDKKLPKELENLEILAPVDYRVARDALRPAFNKLFKETEAHIIFTSQMTEPFPGLSKDQRNRPSISAATFKIIATRADIIANLRPSSGGKFIADMSESTLTSLGKSRIEGFQGQMDLDTFITRYKELVF
ncbi:MAG: hypothetical protein HMLIMOIP_002675 [Candidatus Nitrosomirales archaeon]|jgi:hypothetical protein